MISFDAAVLFNSKESLVMCEVKPKHELQPFQVLVRLIYSGICGAQINEINATKGVDKYLPHLLGHEGYGEIISIGQMVKHVKVGDRVILHWMPRGNSDSATPQYESNKGVVNAGWVTTFNQYAVVSSNRCTPIITNIEEQYLPLLGCSLTTAIGVITNDANLKIGETVVVLGSGGVGLLTISAARLAGASFVIGVDNNKNKTNLITDFGADEALISTNMSMEELNKKLIEMIGTEPDVIIETTGNKNLIELAFQLASKGGRAILVGVPDVKEKIQIDSLPLHFGMTLTGSKGGGIKPESHIPRIIRLIEKDLLNITKFPLEIIKFEDINLGIEMVKKGVLGRVIIQF